MTLALSSYRSSAAEVHETHLVANVHLEFRLVFSGMVIVSRGRADCGVLFVLCDVCVCSRDVPCIIMRVVVIILERRYMNCM